MRLFIHYISLIIFVLPLVGGDMASQQAKLLVQFFSDQMNIDANDIEVKLLHTPDMPQQLLTENKIKVQSGRQSLNLGHQTLWLVHQEGTLVKKRWPITAEVQATLRMPVATRSIRRLEIIDNSAIEYKKIRVGREYKRLISASAPLMGKMASQSIRAGRVIERNMIKTAPDVLLGDELQIILQNKGVQLALPGIAKQEGLIGEVIRVQCPTTRKEFRGLLHTQGEVLVSLR